MIKYLLHATKVHLKVMQKPTESLCNFTLKIIDILTDDDIERKEDESKILLILMLNNILDSIIETIDRIEKDTMTQSNVLSPAMTNIRRDLKTFLIKESVRDVIKLKSTYEKAIIDVAKAMTLFNLYGLAPCIKLEDLQGNQIC